MDSETKSETTAQVVETLASRFGHSPEMQADVLTAEASRAGLTTPATEYQVSHNDDGVYQVPDHVGDTVKIVPTIDEQVHAAAALLLTGQKIAELASNPGVLAGLAEKGLEIDRVSLDKFLEFRDQVIAAFKHMGLDTRKHFS